MKLVKLLFIALFCTNCEQDNNTNKSEKNSTDFTVQNNKVRENKRNIQSVTEFLLVEEDTINGILAGEKHFDLQGNITRKVYYGIQNEKDTSATIEEYFYDENGKLIRHTETNGVNLITTENFYNAQNQLISSVVSQSGEEEIKTDYFYNKEQIAEEKVTVGGNYRYTDQTTYQFDKNNNITEKITVRNFPDNRTETVAHFQYIYSNQNKISEEKKLRPHNHSCCVKHLHFSYDNAENIKETKVFEEEGFVSYSKFTYNEFGELLVDSTYYGNDGYWKEFQYQLDEYGNKKRVVNFKNYGNSKGFRYKTEYY